MHTDHQEALRCCYLRQLESQLAEAAQQEADLQRKLADRQRAFNLLHADFAAQRALVEDADVRSADNNAVLAKLHSEIASARAAAIQGEACRAFLETARMQAEDVEGVSWFGLPTCPSCFNALHAVWKAYSDTMYLFFCMSPSQRTIAGSICGAWN